MASPVPDAGNSPSNFAVPAVKLRDREYSSEHIERHIVVQHRCAKELTVADGTGVEDDSW